MSFKHFINFSVSLGIGWPMFQFSFGHWIMLHLSLGILELHFRIELNSKLPLRSIGITYSDGAYYWLWLAPEAWRRGQAKYLFRARPPAPRPKW